MAKLGELPNVLYATALGNRSAKTIWRTVVFAGAMLGGACGGKASSTTTPAMSEQAPVTVDPSPAGTEGAMPAASLAADPCAATPTADPCAAPAEPPADATASKQPEQDAVKPTAKPRRPRTNPGSRPTGRGFILS